MVPVSPRSGLRAESCEGPQLGGELPAGSQPGIATAANDRRSSEEDDLLVRSIVDRCLGKNEFGAAGPSKVMTGGNTNEDAMSVSSVTTPLNPNLKRSRKYQEDVSDSDIEDQPLRSHKVLRSHVIGSDNDEADDGPIVLSDSPENMEKVRKRRARARSRAMDLDPPVNMDLSIDLANLVFSHCPNRLVLEDVVDKDADNIAGLAIEWLDDMELVRTKSKNLNGRLSGCLKDRIVCMRSMIKILVDRIKDSGDITYLRRRNDELAAQLRESKREELVCKAS